MVEKAKRDNPNITKIIFYTNSEFGLGQGQKEPQAKIETEQKGKELDIQIEWRTKSFFESLFVSEQSQDISKYFFEQNLKWELSVLGFKDVLHQYYENSFQKISFLINNHKKPIEDIYINLAIIQNEKDEQDNKKLISRESFLSSYEEIYKPKEPISIEELIKKSKKSLVYGKAGIGKTTLCKYIAYMWAKGELYQEFDYVIYIALIEWKNKGLKGAIKDNYYSQDEDDIDFDFKHNNFKILFLFDGYDELVEEKKRLLRDEIEKVGLSHYIITSRPYGYQRNDFRVDEHFETIGFTDDNAQNYIEKFLKTSIGIKHIAYIPLMLEIICTLWQDKFEFNKVFTSSMTMTELYHDVVEYILKNHSANKDDKRVYKRQNRKNIQEVLGKIAFEGLKQQVILFDGRFIEDVLLDNEIDTFENSVIYAGFLKFDCIEKDILDNQFEFPHLTFQEYFASYYVNTLSLEKQQKVIQKWKFYPHFQVFFTFWAGLAKNKEFLLAEIQKEPRDIVGFYELSLFVMCTHEMVEEDLSEERIILLNEELKKWLFLLLHKNADGILFQIVYMVRHLLQEDFFDFFLSLLRNPQIEYYTKDRTGSLIAAK
ncbi:MAG: Unknown protein [uncultured Sulfurovum sp.]|uniref:NACHT domain-containing protein n=1 Tax=uncultured Sulfurovum sp. TaxID=269237 RepID=A0A6S6U014_9BACT|nr:MAG: Unknown protein [uncultured Sulfurovum sp.]